MLRCSSRPSIIADWLIPCNNLRGDALERRTTLPLATSRSRNVRLSPDGSMDGIHLLGEWFACPASLPLHDADALRSLCTDATRDAGLDAVGERFHQFEPHGVTGVVLLAESHLAIHTWP